MALVNGQMRAHKREVKRLINGLRLPEGHGRTEGRRWEGVHRVHTIGQSPKTPYGLMLSSLLSTELTNF